MTVLTDQCGQHCGAKRHGYGPNDPLYVGHCKCPDCECPWISETLSMQYDAVQDKFRLTPISARAVQTAQGVS